MTTLADRLSLLCPHARWYAFAKVPTSYLNSRDICSNCLELKTTAVSEAGSPEGTLRLIVERTDEDIKTARSPCAR